MGVPGFLRWLHQEFPSACRTATQIDTGRFHTLFIDLNSTLHRDASASNGDVASISSTVDELIALVKPKRLVYLAIDGVPPRMKERLQRERRAKAVDVRNLMDQRGQQHSSFNSYAITPGTKWMRKVERHLEEYITQKRKVDARWRDLRVVFSGSRDPGEGEQKIMEYLRTQESSSMGDSHCVWSNDADTVLLSLATHVRNITMVSERQRSGVSSYAVVDIDKLGSELVKRYAPKTSSNAGPSSIKADKQLVDDLVFMTFFAGNDFLPPVAYLPAPMDAAFISHLWAMYADLPPEMRPLHDQGRINPRALRQLLGWLEVVGEQRMFKKHIGVTTLGSQLTALRARRMAWETQRVELGDSGFTLTSSIDALEDGDIGAQLDSGRKSKRKKGKGGGLSRSERRARKGSARCITQSGKRVPYVWTGAVSDLGWADDGETREVGLLDGAAPIAEPFPVYEPLQSKYSAPTLTLNGLPLISPVLVPSFKLLAGLAKRSKPPGAVEVVGYVSTARIKWLQSLARSLGLECAALKPSDAGFESAYAQWRDQRERVTANKQSGEQLEGGQMAPEAAIEAAAVEAMIVTGDLDYCPPTWIVTVSRKTPQSTPQHSLTAATFAAASLVNDDDWDVLYADARTEHKRDAELSDWKSGFYRRHYGERGSGFVGRLCTNYANALGWTAQYYFSGQVSSWEFAWPDDIESAQSGVAPLASDLLALLEPCGDKWGFVPVSQNQPPLPREHMLSVLPRDSWALLDNEEHELASLLFDSKRSEDARQQVRDQMASRPEDIASVRIWL